jgi:IS5 family transposase
MGTDDWLLIATDTRYFNFSARNSSHAYLGFPEADRAFHAGRYQGDGETYRLADRRGASSEGPCSPDPSDQGDGGGGRRRSQGAAKLCPGEPEDGPDHGEVRQEQEGADRQGREEAPLLCPANRQPGPRSARQCQEGRDKGQKKKRRRVAEDPARLVENVTEESRVLGRVITQTVNRIRKRPVEDKRIYSTHEPHVTCITKNKAGKKHEYGVKVFLSVDANGFVVAHREYPDNRHDSTTLGDALEDWVKATGSLPKMLAADRGYRSKEEREPDLLEKVPKVAIPLKGKIQGPNEQASWFKRLTARRAGLEAIISHLKTDHRMNRSRYKGLVGDHLNVSWAVIAWNTKKWVECCGT